MAEYIIKKLEFDNFEVLIPLMKDCFGMDINIEYFKWKFLENPSGIFLGFTAVETISGEIAAYFGFIPEKYSMNGEEKIIFQAHDLMTHSNHRRRGLFKMVTDACLDYIDQNHELFVFAFGGNHSTPGFLKWGWKHVFDFHYLFYPNIFCQFRKFNKIDNSIIEENLTDYKILEPLIQNHKKDNEGLYSVRSVEHMNWRYRNPLNTYRVDAVKIHNKIEGFVCYYYQNNKIYLFDFIFSNSRSQQSLLLHLKKMVVNKKMKGIVSFCKKNGKEDQVLKSAGFINNPFNFGPLHTKTPFIFYSDEENQDFFSNSKLWLIDAYDHDSL